MGWNFVKGLSQHHEVHVITEKEKWEKDLLLFLEEHGITNIYFHFIRKKRNRRLRKLWPPSYYWYYKTWQKKAFQLAKELDGKENFDIIHQLNMVGYREPGYLWKIDKPFVWGPIGGLENSPLQLLPYIGFKGFVFFFYRNLYNSLQRNFLNRPKKAATRDRAFVIAATKGNQNRIKELWGVEADIICEVGQETNHTEMIVSSVKHRREEPLRIVWSGLHIPRKNLSLLLQALKNIKTPYELHILGKGEMTAKWKMIAHNLGIAENCKWYGWVERSKSLSIMQSGHVFCITSISDLTSSVTLEAISFGLPVICLDHCGFADIINENCGIKVPISNYTEVVTHFKEAIETLDFDENLRQRLSQGALERANDFSWNGKVEKLNKIYSDLLIS